MLARRSTVRLTNRDTTMAMYATPASCSSITTERAKAFTGITSLRPVLDRVVKLRKSSSIQVRSPVGSIAAVKLLGSMACRTVKE